MNAYLNSLPLAILFTAVFLVGFKLAEGTDFAALRMRFLKWTQRFRRQKDIAGSSQAARQRYAKKALRGLNCEAQWSSDGTTRQAIYQYQSGHYQLRIEEDQPYVELLYLFMAQAKADQLDIMRQLVNMTNVNSQEIKAIYTFNESENVYDVHLKAALLLDQQRAQSILRHTMTECFAWQSALNKRFLQMAEYNKRLTFHDVEQNADEHQRARFLMRELEMSEQPTAQQQRQMPAEGYTLGQWMRTVMQLQETVPVALTLDGRPLEPTEAYDLSTSLIAGDTFTSTEATLVYAFYQASDLAHERHLVMHLQSQDGDKDTLYYRVTAMLTPLAASPDTPLGGPEARPMVQWALLAYDITPAKQRLEEFRYNWMEAQAKLKGTNHAPLTDDQRLLYHCSSMQAGRTLYTGRRLFLDSRYAEALPWLQRGYEMATPMVYEMNDNQREYFYELCYYLGACHIQLHQYKQANFYLDLIYGLHRAEYSEAMLVAMMRDGDFRAHKLLDQMLADVRSALAGDDVASEKLEPFHHFLLRSKAQILVDEGQLGEARKVLEKLVDVADSADFAIRLLSQIDRDEAQQQ